MRLDHAPGGGIIDGFSISSIVPSVSYTWYSTFGTVVHEIEIELALEPLLHDLHVQQAEEAAAEAEAERGGRLRLVVQRRVVQLELLQRVAQLSRTACVSVG